VEPTETAIGLWVRKRQQKSRLIRCCGVGLQVISDGRRACHIIGEADKVRHFELLPVPVRYSDRVFTKLDWVEFWSSLRSSTAQERTPKGRAESRSSVGILYHKLRRMSPTNFSARNWVGPLYVSLFSAFSAKGYLPAVSSFGWQNHPRKLHFAPVACRSRPPPNDLPPAYSKPNFGFLILD
jgi:hypothetical protein